MEWVGFPGLGIEKIGISRRAFSVFGLDVNWYGLIICFGIVLAVCYVYFNSERFGVLRDDVCMVAVVGIVFGIVGARVYYVVFNFEEFSSNLLEVFNIRGGGLAIYGAIIFSTFFGGLFCKFRNIKLFPMLDVVGIGFLIGQAIGRWGNFFNIEAYGCTTNLPWGMVASSINPSISPVHPTFFYESVWCAIGFFLIHNLSKRRRFDGQIFLTYVAWYGFERFFVEGLRTDSLFLVKDFLKVSQVLAFISFFVSVGILIYVLKFKMRGRDEKFLYVNSAEWKNKLKGAIGYKNG